MSRTRSSSLIYAALTVALVCLAVGTMFGQANDVYQVTYYNHPSSTVGQDSTYHVVNPGAAVTALNRNGVPVNGNLCANIYVFNDDEQEVACCGCQLTPDSETTLSLEKDLLANPVNPLNLTHTGVIKIISGTPNVSGAPYCDPAADINPIVPTPDLRAWATHTQSEGSTTPETEEEFAPAPLSANELVFAENLCSDIINQGSGKGLCTCGYGD